jgi:hypothetical protein
MEASRETKSSTAHSTPLPHRNTGDRNTQSTRNPRIHRLLFNHTSISLPHSMYASINLPPLNRLDNPHRLPQKLPTPSITTTITTTPIPRAPQSHVSQIKHNRTQHLHPAHGTPEQKRVPATHASSRSSTLSRIMTPTSAQTFVSNSKKSVPMLEAFHFISFQFRCMLFQRPNTYLLCSGYLNYAPNLLFSSFLL